ncbi:MAG TPA: phosphoribosyltransferase family protein, partial [Lacipirellulaceae bacterium]|nr:phosphoribosyltransferase family protein [Lacipirellulaceae bacterium]
IKSLAVPDELVNAVAQRERRELQRQRELYRGGEPPPQVRDKIVILVDDGLATGSTMRASISALRKQEPKKIVVAVPVGASETCAELHGDADELVCAIVPRQFMAVGAWYCDFSPTSDATVRALLQEAAHHPHAPVGG